ncbi:MAG: DNA-binding protein [Thermodesulfobacteriota bacterium]|nr:DNA-binding protein [Thermodesulfobacteriota bacterium]
MRRAVTLLVILSVVSLLVATETFAQRGMRWRGSGGWAAEGRYGRMYDPKTVETISGEVVSVDKITPMKGMSYGVHLMIKTDKETVSVHLGPGWYIGKQDVKIEPKDKVEVTGSRITFGGKPAIIAAEVKKGEEVLKLRDENGLPAWCGWRRR